MTGTRLRTARRAREDPTGADGAALDGHEDIGEASEDVDEIMKANVMKLTKDEAKTTYKKEEMLENGFEIFKGGERGEAFAQWITSIKNADDVGLLYYLSIMGRLWAEADLLGEDMPVSVEMEKGLDRRSVTAISLLLSDDVKMGMPQCDEPEELMMHLYQKYTFVGAEAIEEANRRLNLLTFKGPGFQDKLKAELKFIRFLHGKMDVRATSTDGSGSTRSITAERHIL